MGTAVRVTSKISGAASGRVRAVTKGKVKAVAAGSNC